MRFELPIVDAAQPTRTTPGLRLSRQLTVLFPRASLVVGLVLLLVGQAPLGAATLALGLVALGFRRVGRLWTRLSGSGRSDETSFAAAGRAMQTEAAALVTVQGVALTLIFSFLGDQPASAVTKVAAISLVVGLCLALLLSGLVTTTGIVQASQRAVAFQVFNWTTWACAYGLLCLTSAVVLER